MATAISKPGADRDLASGVPWPLDSLLIAAYACVAVALGCVAVSDRFAHWFMIPVVLCGVLSGADAVDWLRGRLDTFDFIGLFGIFGLYFFFLAPLLHVYWDYWLPYVQPPPDWREWLGWMSLLNAFGLLIYRAARGKAIAPAPSPWPIWKIDRRRCLWVGAAALGLAALLQAQVYASYGGVASYIATATDLDEYQTAMRGMGLVFAFSESFPIIALFLFVVLARRWPAARSWLVLGLVLLAYFGLKLVFGGLRGSRNNTIIGMFWAIGLIHQGIRPISKRIVLAGCAALIAFVYFYGFFKGAGLDAVYAFESADDRAALEAETSRNIRYALLGDFGRSDVQAYVLYRIVRPGSDYRYALGRTYYAAVAFLIPSQIAERPPSKTKEGTEALYGRGSYIAGVAEASQLYGIAGESMLNFGPAGVPGAFLAFGLVVRALRRLRASLHPSDARLLLYPFLTVMCLYLPVVDLENIVFNVIKNLAFPLMVVLLSSSWKKNRSCEP